MRRFVVFVAVARKMHIVDICNYEHDEMRFRAPVSASQCINFAYIFGARLGKK